MIRATRFLPVALLIACTPLAAARADAQTRNLTVHISTAGASGNVTAVSGAVGTCQSLTGTCVFKVSDGATVRLSAAIAGPVGPHVAPGRFSGTGPAAGCALSTCTFVMTADADLTATFTDGDGPTATMTTTLTGDGSGGVTIDGIRCASGSCTYSYLQGSSVQLAADGGASSRFNGYSSPTGDASACGAAANCSFTLSGNSSATATLLAFAGFSVAPSSAIGVPGGPAQTFAATGTYSGGVTGVIPSGPGAWSSAPSLPYRVTGLAAAGLNGKVYAIGGRTISFDPLSVGNGLAAYDPVTQVWTTPAAMLTRRENLGATTAGGLLYAIGGQGAGSVNSGGTFIPGGVLASMERYDPATNTWTMRASMPTPRYGLVAGSINGIVYAAGGADASSKVLATLEAYDPATDTWTQRAPMPTARWSAASGVIDGILYVAGGFDASFKSLTAVEAYDPATNTWTAKAPMPTPAGPGAVADGVLYVIGGLAYHPVANAWTTKAAPPTFIFPGAAASLNGVVYGLGGVQGVAILCCNRAIDGVETFADSLRWSSSAPSVVRIDQNGHATPIAPGKATIVANVGGTTCGVSCPTFSVIGPTTLSLDAPVNNATVTAGAELTIGGWALNPNAPSGTGVDAIHIYAIPSSGSAIFLGATADGESRQDVGAIYGSQFTSSGFILKPVMSSPGNYTIAVYAHNTFTQQFDAVKTAAIRVTAPVSNGLMNVDAPSPGATLTSAFEVGGWAIDTGAPTGTGVDAVQFYVFPNAGTAPGVFIGNGSYGLARSDVGAAFGSRFTRSGYHFTITGLGPGQFGLGVYARSTVTGTYSIIRTQPFTVSATALMSIDSPQPEITISANTIGVAGWSIDRAIEASAQTGTGVDVLHVYAYPNPGSGQTPIFLGVASVGVHRPDVGALYGTRYDNSGYTLTVDRTVAGLAPGIYNIVVHSHSTVTNAFNSLAVVQVTLQ